MNLRKAILGTLLAATLPLLVQAAFLPSSLHAHAVYTFAWPEGDQVCTESYFSTRKDKVKNGKISMSKLDGTLIASAQTDENGGHCFPLPKNSGGLLFVIEAGQGHRAEFTLRAEDLPADDEAGDEGSGEAAPSGTAGGADPSTSTGTSGASGDTSSNSTTGTAGQPSDASSAAGGAVQAAGAATGGSGALTAASIRNIVREEVRNQVGPIARTIAEQANDRTPGLREIVGGLGWIIGLFGVIVLARGHKIPPADKKV
jgi:nickel transport protein